jgi:orotate phosphoribosyltransferase
LAADIDAACRLSGVFTLRSGLTSEEYFDKYLFESNPKLLKRVAEAMVSLLPAGTDLVGGLELGGVPLATVVSQLSGLPAIFVRKRAKDYGTQRVAEGVVDIAGRRVTLIEDVITTGGAVRQAALSLRAQGAEVTSVVCAIDRSDGLPSALNDVDLAVHPVLTRTDLDAVHQQD